MEDAVVVGEQVLHDDPLARVRCVASIGSSGDVDDATVDMHGVVLVDLPDVVQSA
jgi:hypothetical protein